MLNRLTAAVVGCVLVWLSTGALAQAPDVQRRSAVLKRTVQQAELGRFWGAVLVVEKGEVLLAEGFGFANEELEPIGRDSLFDVGSVSKMFTAAAILRLEQDGKLSTSDTVSKFFPDAAGNSDAITLKQLLNHTSGKSDSSGAIQPLAYEDREGAVARFAKSRGTTPGEGFEYCNGGYVVLGAVIEKVTGQTYEKAVRELVLAPAGMKGSGFLDGEGLDVSRQTMRVVSGHGGEPRRALMLDKKLEPWAWGLKGAGGLVTSVDDLIAWEKAIRTGAVLSEVGMKAWTTPAMESYACGWMVGKDEEGRVTHQHGGATRGYRCQLIRYPEQQVFIAVMTGEDGTPDGLARRLADVMLPPTPSNTMAVLKFDPAALNKYKALVAESCDLRIVRQEGKIQVIVDGKDPAREGVATFTLDEGAVRKLAVLIRDNLDSPRHVKATGGVKAGVYLYQYGDVSKAGSHTLAKATWSAMPSYTGRGEKGERVEDPRIVLMLIDPELPNGWPVMMHLDDPSAERLHDQLTAK
jgi:CubicO group peptidase (beta-lactamase class C family)